MQNRYRVDRQIGEGGMGAVYIATDQRFNSTVAIKETFFTDQSLRKAFEREARLLNNLRHPALPRVSDHFIEGDGQFIVMEYIAGEDLSEMMDKKAAAFPIKDVLNWADQLLDALDFLHTQEMPVIHRDIKPQNLKLTPRGQIILLDFGLAKGNPTDAKHQTAAKSVFGYSRSYASLEQIQGTGTDPRSDLYSLAATLYHLITGVVPVDALTRAMKVLNGDADPLVPADKVHTQVPAKVAEVLTRAMALNGNHRPTSAVAMRVMLSEAASDRAVGDANILPDNPATGILTQSTEVMEAATDQATVMEADGTTTPATVAVADTADGEDETSVKTRFDKAASGRQFGSPTGQKTENLQAAYLTDPKPSRKGVAVAATALGTMLAVTAAGYALYVLKPGIFGQGSVASNVAADNRNAAVNAASNTAVVANNAAQNSASNTVIATDATKQLSNTETQADTVPRKDQQDKADVRSSTGGQKPADGKRTDVLTSPPATTDFAESLPAKPPEKPVVEPPSKSVTVTTAGPDGATTTRVMSREDFEKLPPAQKRRIRSIILKQRQQGGHPSPLPTPPE